MSKYVVCESEFQDLECLLAALNDIGITKDKVEVHEEAQALKGYQNDVRSEKANIIIRKRFVGSASNDIGFQKTIDGTYKPIVSEYDLNHNFGKKIASKEFSMLYSQNVSLKQIKTIKGHKLKSCIKNKDGSIEIRVRVD